MPPPVDAAPPEALIARSTLPIAVVVVTHFSGEVLRACLESIPEATAHDVRVVVVDNATTDDSVRRVVERRPEVLFHETGENLGYGRAINYAVDRLGPEIEWILVTNPDTVFLPGSIDALYAAATADPGIGSIGPRILDSDGTIYPSARALPSLGTGVGHALLAHVWPGNPWSRRYRRSRAVETMQHGSMTAGWLSGACVMVRRTAFEQIGGFDERYFMYFEDVQLGDSLGQRGWSNVYLADAVVSHLGGHSTRLASARMLAVHHRSAYLYLAQKYDAWYQAPVRLAVRLGLGVRVALMRLRPSH
ncbi:glycosyltransferase family 2 protein [Rathayibacter sp. VKM Ac-2929]|uniref:glycosyltransferase family 2 protein n=1 Tax=Rathayibacter sp. VKM Ac-2929 TaxID=2929480 RepID=UPI001FB2C698|nr:glycosyltransferase family 2 protein [Rathayibacter sp. VKM Ac-2929]MCJ1672739.1 glycosyltransferase family 2 protein [Rathayibacter sp. VKM Ac-2929]